ncbi:MAG: hypothetical protein H7Z41_06645, partial [Cytophagales bacterium]|nr:hypothetical protein [Armatimonadota bacterium]
MTETAITRSADPSLSPNCPACGGDWRLVPMPVPSLVPEAVCTRCGLARHEVAALEAHEAAAAY